MEIPPPTREPARHDFWHWVDRILTGTIAALLAVVITGPIAIAGAKLTEGTTKASIVFAVSFYGFMIAVAVMIYRSLRRFFGAPGRANPSQGTAGDSDGPLLAMDNSKHASINYIWPIVGIGAGTFIVGSLILSNDPLERLTGGLLYGGVPCGLMGLAYAIFRRNRQWRRQQLPERLDATPCSGEN